jgi:hypothetical protein
LRTVRFRDESEDFFDLEAGVLLELTVFFARFLRLEPRFFAFPPPSCLFTVSHAARSAVRVEAPRFS